MYLTPCFKHISKDVEDGTYFQTHIDCVGGEYSFPSWIDVSDINICAKEGVASVDDYLREYGLALKEKSPWSHCGRNDFSLFCRWKGNR